MIKIPFLPFFREPMLLGHKTMTCRTKRLGYPGDVFEAFGGSFILTHVMRIRLGEAITNCYEQEGCDSVEELRGIWKEIHPVKGVDDDQIVWAHCFRRQP